LKPGPARRRCAGPAAARPPCRTPLAGPQARPSVRRAPCRAHRSRALASTFGLILAEPGAPSSPILAISTHFLIGGRSRPRSEILKKCPSNAIIRVVSCARIS
jgi:hypothetical protein